jgi:hypothetical protein
VRENCTKRHTSRKMRWAGYVARREEKMYKIEKGNLNQRDHLDNLGIDVSRTLKK